MTTSELCPLGEGPSLQPLPLGLFPWSPWGWWRRFWLIWIIGGIIDRRVCQTSIARHSEESRMMECTTTSPLLLTAPAAAILCGTSLRTWRSWNAAGRIPRAIHIGRKVFWKPEELESVGHCLLPRPRHLGAHAGMNPSAPRVYPEYAPSMRQRNTNGKPL